MTPNYDSSRRGAWTLGVTLGGKECGTFGSGASTGLWLLQLWAGSRGLGDWERWRILPNNPRGGAWERWAARSLFSVAVELQAVAVGSRRWNSRVPQGCRRTLPGAARRSLGCEDAAAFELGEEAIDVAHRNR